MRVYVVLVVDREVKPSTIKRIGLRLPTEILLKLVGCPWFMVRGPKLEQRFARRRFRKLKLISSHHLHAICTTLCRLADANHLEQQTKEMITNQWSMCEMVRHYREGLMAVPGVLPIKKRFCCHQTVRIQSYVRSLYD